MTLYFIQDLVNDLNPRESFLVNFYSTEGRFLCFQSTGDSLRVFVSFTQLTVFLSFFMHS